MPILEVTLPHDQTLDNDACNRLRALGEIIGYSDHRKVWVTVRNGLRQADVAYVNVMVEAKDRIKERFAEFCTAIAQFLRAVLGKSVEVITPGSGTIVSLAWAPTAEGAAVYGS